jgi:hypothetical protein
MLGRCAVLECDRDEVTTAIGRGFECGLGTGRHPQFSTSQRVRGIGSGITANCHARQPSNQNVHRIIQGRSRNGRTEVPRLDKDFVCVKQAKVSDWIRHGQVGQVANLAQLIADARFAAIPSSSLLANELDRNVANDCLAGIRNGVREIPQRVGDAREVRRGCCAGAFSRRRCGVSASRRDRHVLEVMMVEKRGLMWGNLDEEDVHILVRKNEVMVAFLAHGDAAGGVRRGSLGGEGQCGYSDGRDESQYTTER